MLGLSRIDLRMIRCGPAIGQRGLFIDIKESDSKESVYSQLKSSLKKEIEITDKMIPLELFYNTAIDGSKRTYLCFTGGDIDRKSNYKEFSDLMVAISKESVQFQKDVRIDKMSPPFSIFFGKPLYLTGSMNDAGFYQNFNCITGIIKQKGEVDTELEEFNRLSAQEILNHPFGSLVVQIDRTMNKDFDKILQPILSYEVNNKIYIADGFDSSALREYCLVSGLRYQDYLDNEWTRERK